MAVHFVCRLCNSRGKICILSVIIHPSSLFLVLKKYDADLFRNTATKSRKSLSLPSTSRANCLLALPHGGRETIGDKRRRRRRDGWMWRLRLQSLSLIYLRHNYTLNFTLVATLQRLHFLSCRVVRRHLFSLRSVDSLPFRICLTTINHHLNLCFIPPKGK